MYCAQRSAVCALAQIGEARVLHFGAIRFDGYYFILACKNRTQRELPASGPAATAHVFARGFKPQSRADKAPTVLVCRVWRSAQKPCRGAKSQ
jgi:hypothetical protein